MPIFLPGLHNVDHVLGGILSRRTGGTVAAEVIFDCGSLYTDLSKLSSPPTSSE